jgi:transposase
MSQRGNWAGKPVNLKRRSAVTVQAMGYFWVGTSKLDDWSSFAIGQLGLQAVDRGGAMRAFRMDDRKQRLIVDGGLTDGERFFGWEVSDATALDTLARRLEPLLIVRRVVREQLGILHRRLLAIVRDDDVCRRLMTVPGVGPVVALTYRATVDVPARFRNSKAVGAVFGLTPSRYQSGESDRIGRISRCGDEMTRMMLYEAAQSMLAHSAKWSWLKAWAMKIARHRGMKKAIVALARRLAVIMHRIWVDGTEFRWTREVAAA